MNQDGFKSQLEQHKIYLDSKGESGRRIHFKDLNLTDIKFYEADLTDAKFDNVLFSETRLNSVNLYGATIEQCIFNDCQMSDACLEKTTIKNCQFHNTHLHRGNFKDAKLHSNVIRHSCWSAANFANATVQSYFTHTDLKQSIFANTNLSRSTFAYCEWADIKLDNPIVPWTSRQFLSQLLLREADTIWKMQLAGLLLIESDLSWTQLLDIDHPEKDWALQTLAKYIQPDDNHPYMLEIIYKQHSLTSHDPM